MALTDKLSNIADAIRVKIGSSELLTLDAMPAAIESIEAGGGSSGLFKAIVDDSITEVTAEDLAGIETICRYAFCDCTLLTSVVIPDSVTVINNDAFAYCSALTSVSMPKTLTSLGQAVFTECRRLASIVIPDGVQTIDYNVFKNCVALASVTIPTSVTNIQHNAFQFCYRLKDVYYKGTEEQWNQIAGTAVLADATIHFNS